MMWNLLRCLLKTLVALLVDDVLLSDPLTNTVAATVLIGVIATGVIGAAHKLIAGVAGVGMHPSVAGLQPSVPLRGTAKDRCRFDAPRKFGATSKHCEKIVPIRGASNIGADSRHLRKVRC